METSIRIYPLSFQANYNVALLDPLGHDIKSILFYSTLNPPIPVFKIDLTTNYKPKLHPLYFGNFFKTQSSSTLFLLFFNLYIVTFNSLLKEHITTDTMVDHTPLSNNIDNTTSYIDGDISTLLTKAIFDPFINLGANSDFLSETAISADMFLNYLKTFTFKISQGALIIAPNINAENNNGGVLNNNNLYIVHFSNNFSLIDNLPLTLIYTGNQKLLEEKLGNLAAHDIIFNSAVSVTSENTNSLSTDEKIDNTDNFNPEGTPIYFSAVNNGLASGNEDSSISIGSAISNMFTLGEAGESITTYTITGVPVGVSFNNGITVNTGTAVVSAAQLSGLTLTPVANFNGSINLSVTATENDNGNTAISTPADLTITVNPIAVAPSSASGAASGNEDSSISIGSAISNMFTLGEAGESITTYTITGVPVGVSFNNGVTVNTGTAVVSAAQLSGLTLTPVANFNGSINLSVTATENDNGNTAISTPADLTITVNPIAVAPSSASGAASGNEDSSISIGSAISNMFTLGEAGESITTYTITGVPVGVSFNNGVTVNTGTAVVSAAQLSGLTLTPVANFNGAINLSVTATENDNGNIATSTPADLTITVNPIAGTPTVSSTTLSGDENTAIALGTTLANMVTLDPAESGESISLYTIENIPVGATFNNGVTVTNGKATITPAQLTGLTITPPLDFIGTINLSISATEYDNSATKNSVTPGTLGLTITGDHVIDLSAQGVALTINSDFIDPDQSVTVLGTLGLNTILTYPLPDGLQNLTIIGSPLLDTFNANSIWGNNDPGVTLFSANSGLDTLSYANDTNSITVTYTNLTSAGLDGTVTDTAAGGLTDIFEDFSTITGSLLATEDTIDFSAASSAISIDMTLGTATQGSTTITLSNFENFIGAQNANDTFKAGLTAQTFIGGDKTNTFTGGTSNSTFVTGDAGSKNTITLGVGSETVEFNTGNLGSTQNTITGYLTTDKLDLSNILPSGLGLTNATAAVNAGYIDLVPSGVVNTQLYVDLHHGAGLQLLVTFQATLEAQINMSNWIFPST